MHFNAEREPTKYELEAIEAIRQSHINLPTQDFQKSPLWSEKLKAGQYEVKPESVCNCTSIERAFLDEIREKFAVSEDFKGDPDYAIHFPQGHSMLWRYDFKTPLKELVNDTKTKTD